ncbi:MAG: hypothetical protein KC636_05580, partial [Myxococcales bacterium]|nr:hypothetical protein [Myxococcales bacterium]
MITLARSRTAPLTAFLTLALASGSALAQQPEAAPQDPAPAPAADGSFSTDASFDTAAQPEGPADASGDMA